MAEQPWGGTRIRLEQGLLKINQDWRAKVRSRVEEELAQERRSEALTKLKEVTKQIQCYNTRAMDRWRQVRVTRPRGLERDQALEGARNAKESCGGMRMREWTLRGLPKD